MVCFPPRPCALLGRGCGTGSIVGTILGGPRCAGGVGREREGPGSSCGPPGQGNHRLGWGEKGEKPLNQEKCGRVRGQDCSQLGAPADAPSA